MLNKDGAVPSFPSWTAHGFFSLNTRPGLTVHRSLYGHTPRLKALESIQAFPPCYPCDTSPYHDRLSVPSNKLRRKVFGRQTSPFHDDLLTPVESLVANQLKRRRTGLAVWEDDAPTGAKTAEGTAELLGSGTQFDESLPLLQRKAWTSFGSSSGAPIPFSVVKEAVCDADWSCELGASAFTATLDKRPSRNKTDAYRRGNLLAHSRAGNEDVCVLAPSGKLHSMTAFCLSTDVSGPSPSQHIKRYAHCKKIPDIITFDDDVVSSIVTLPYSDNIEGTRLLAATSSSVCLARISSDVLKWEDHLDIPHVKSSALNPLYPEEFSILSTEGLFCGTADGYRAACKSVDVSQNGFHDVQCLSPEAQYRQVEYGTHPRTVMLASRTKLVQFDLRARTRGGRFAIFDLERNPQTQARDLEIGTFCFAPNSNGFQLLLTTRASLSYIDIRRPEVPLLDWSLVLPSAPDEICAVPLNPDPLRSDLVLLASSRWGYAEVFHAVHAGEHDAFSSMFRAVQPELYSLPKVEMMWSDLPLPRHNLSPLQDAMGGITLVPDHINQQATVIQWSRGAGLMLHPFEITPRFDQEDGAVERSQKTVDKAENSVNLNNSILPLRRKPHARCSCASFPVSRSTPGSYLHSRAKRLLLRDVRELRKRICSSEDDDKDENCSSRVPRPYMQDLFSNDNFGEDTPFATSSPEETPRLQSSPRKQAAPRDDTADRETVIGEAALLRSEDSDDCDNPESGTLDFLDAIGSGCLFDELARSVRSGIGHDQLPLGVSGLTEAVSESPLTKSYKTEWHTQCEEVHSASSSAVSTADTLPGWLFTTVYHTTEAEKGESLRSSSVPESSQYGLLLARMQTEFFD